MNENKKIGGDYLCGSGIEMSHSKERRMTHNNEVRKEEESDREKEK